MYPGYECVKNGSAGLTWTNKEVVALLDVWLNAAVQAKLQGAYRNDHIYRRIVSKLYNCLQVPA